MLQRLRDLFSAATANGEAGQPRAHQLQLATAVLLVEVMRAEPQLHAPERAAVRRALASRFDLTADELASLLARAEETVSGASDFHQFTSLINEHFSQEEKIGIVEQMWGVAYADGELEATENHVISRVAGLLHVTHGEYIAAKLHAKEAAGPPSTASGPTA